MQLRIAGGVLILFFVLGVALGCGGGSSNTSSEPDTSDRATGTAAPAGEALALDEYLIITLKAQSALNEVIIPTAPPAPGSDPEGFQEYAAFLVQALRDWTNDAASELSSVIPPPEAQSYHESYLSYLSELDESMENFADAIAADDESRIVGAAVDFLTAVGSAARLQIEGDALTLRALRAKPETEVNTYLIESIVVRSQASEALELYATELNTNLGIDLGGIVDLAEELIVTLEMIQAEWLALTPPAELGEVHDLQAEANARVIEFEHDLVDAARSGDAERIAEASLEANSFAAESSALSNEWLALLILALSTE